MKTIKNYQIMKTKINLLGLVFVISTLTFSLSASENKKSVLAGEESIKIESWMMSESFFSFEDKSNPNVVEIAVSNPDFSILVEAVVKADLVDALSGTGPFTVFAPTNAAFKTLFSQLGIEGVKNLTKDQLIPILTYHVVSGKVVSKDLSNSTVETLNTGKSLKIDLASGVKINDSKVVTADIIGKNGVIHVIDKVLIPN